MRLYWDSSALVKLFLPETDSAYFDELLIRTGTAVETSAIAAAELLCAAYRKESAGAIKRGKSASVMRGFRGDCQTGRIVLIPFGADVWAEAEEIVKAALVQPRPVMIRALDAIHVATARTIRAETVVATDSRLREVAAIQKFRLLP